MSGIFGNRDLRVEGLYRYDMKTYDTASNPAPVAEYRLAQPTPVRFELDTSQRALLERYEGIYGTTTVGVGRIVSKVYVRKLFRHATSGADLTAPGESELRYRVAGLQN
jgi:hypothetical protein